MREKLIELLRKVQYQGNAVHGYHDKYIQNGELADHLIANGVVVSKMETTTDKDTNVPSNWIPVTERLPEQYHAVIVWTRYRELGEATYDGKHFRWDCDEDYADVTHWMELPEPPKGE